MRVLAVRHLPMQWMLIDIRMNTEWLLPMASLVYSGQTREAGSILAA